MSVTVKICGLQRADDVRLCLQLGVDILGFVTEYPLPGPWNLSRQQVRPLLQLIRPPCRSCLVTGGPPEKVIELASSLRPAIVQLHYRETLEETITIADALHKLQIQVIRNVPTQAEDRLAGNHRRAGKTRRTGIVTIDRWHGARREQTTFVMKELQASQMSRAHGKTFFERVCDILGINNIQHG